MESVLYYFVTTKPFINWINYDSAERSMQNLLQLKANF